MCKICDNYLFENVGISFNEVLGCHTVYFSSKIGMVPDDEQFKFCPACGKPIDKSDIVHMTFGDLRNILQDHSTVWVDDENGEHLAEGELRFISKKYDNRKISLMFPEHYKALYASGITVILCEE